MHDDIVDFITRVGRAPHAVAQVRRLPDLTAIDGVTDLLTIAKRPVIALTCVWNVFDEVFLFIAAIHRAGDPVAQGWRLSHLTAIDRAANLRAVAKLAIRATRRARRVEHPRLLFAAHIHRALNAIVHHRRLAGHTLSSVEIARLDAVAERGVITVVVASTGRPRLATLQAIAEFSRETQRVVGHRLTILKLLDTRVDRARDAVIAGRRRPRHTLTLIATLFAVTEEPVVTVFRGGALPWREAPGLQVTDLPWLTKRVVGHVEAAAFLFVTGVDGAFNAIVGAWRARIGQAGALKTLLSAIAKEPVITIGVDLALRRDVLNQLRLTGVRRPVFGDGVLKTCVKVVIVVAITDVESLSIATLVAAR